MNRVEKVIEYLTENVNERLCIDDIATYAHLSTVQLYRVFKTATGYTPIQYHELLKINESFRLLIQSEKINHVAYELGYENYETFSRAFRRICNCTPSDMLWGYTLINNLPNEEYYVLVKQDASTSQINQLITHSREIGSDLTDLHINRLYPTVKSKPEIRRCYKSEEQFNFYKILLENG